MKTVVTKQKTTLAQRAMLLILGSVILWPVLTVKGISMMMTSIDVGSMDGFVLGFNYLIPNLLLAYIFVSGVYKRLVSNVDARIASKTKELESKLKVEAVDRLESASTTEAKPKRKSTGSTSSRSKKASRAKASVSGDCDVQQPLASDYEVTFASSFTNDAD